MNCDIHHSQRNRLEKQQYDQLLIINKRLCDKVLTVHADATVHGPGADATDLACFT